MSGLFSDLLCLGHVAMHPKGNQSSILIAFTFMLQVQLCTTCRRTFADSAQGVKPGRDIHVRQSELLACLLHHMMKLIRCALLWGAQPCPAPVLFLPYHALTSPQTVVQHITLSLPNLALRIRPVSSCPGPNHSALPSSNSFWASLPTTCPTCHLPCPAALQQQAVCVQSNCTANRLFSPQAITAAAVQCLKLLGAVLVVRRALRPYKPLPPNWWVSFPLPYLQSYCCTYSKLRW